jgi:hypothetical protein
VRLLLLFCIPVLLSGQPVPAERRADTYAVYSAVMASPRLSHPDDNKKYLIEEISGNPAMEMKDQTSCIRVPDAYRERYTELLADRETQVRARYRLERAIQIEKPYVLLTKEQSEQFGRSRGVSSRSREEMELFRGGSDLITLGNVYFDRQRTLAIVYTGAWCGALCGFWTWRVFTRNPGDGWEEQKWVTCMSIARSQRLPVFRLADDEVSDEVAVEFFDNVGIEIRDLGPGAAGDEHGGLTFGRGDRGLTRFKPGGGVDVVRALADQGDDGAVDAIDLPPDFFQGCALCSWLHTV